MEKAFLVYEDFSGQKRRVSASGPFFKHSVPLDGRLAFYVNRYWLDDPQPWWHPAEYSTQNYSENPNQAAKPMQAHRPIIHWEEPQTDAFFEDFFETKCLIEKGKLEKSVPFVSQQGQSKNSAQEIWDYCAETLNLASSSVLRPYGFCYQNEFTIGASPELLYSFDTKNLTLHTMALAGTRPLEHAEELLTDAKEQAEHQLVIKGIYSALKMLGPSSVKILPSQILRSPPLAHLLTPITAELFDYPSHQSLIKLIHPTPALGLLPKSGLGVDEWRHQNYLRDPMRSFGAPFGLKLENGDAYFIVSIRNISFSEIHSGTSVKLSSGCGVIASSKVENEWNELALKRRAIQQSLGLSCE